MSEGIPMGRWAARLATAALAAGLLVLGGAGAPRGVAGLAAARAEEDWFVEFEAVCSKTQDAMTLSDDELRTLVTRCKALEPKIEALDPSHRKVWSKRLQQCRDLYQFVLASRGKA
jgi:hypothetical protein